MSPNKVNVEKIFTLQIHRASIYLFINNKELMREVSFKGLGFISFYCPENFFPETVARTFKILWESEIFRSFPRCKFYQTPTCR